MNLTMEEKNKCVSAMDACELIRKKLMVAESLHDFSLLIAFLAEYNTADTHNRISNYLRLISNQMQG